ncbi:LONP2, partial [Cordylochernes scorpioides]
MVKNQLLTRSSIASTIIGVVPREKSKEEQVEEDTSGPLSRIHKVGTAGIVVQITGTNWPHQSYSIMVTGLCRFRIESLEETSNGLLGTVCQLDRLPGEHAGLLLFQRILSSVPIESLPDICASVVKASHEEKLQILDAVNITERFRRTLPLLARQIEYLQNIQKGRNNKDITWPVDINKIVLARKPIRRPDYDDLEDGDEIGVLEKRFRLGNRKLSKGVLQRLKKMPPHVPEHAVTRNYVELILELPWNKMTEEHLDLKKSRCSMRYVYRRDLDQDHFGMDKLKKRVLEYLAVRQLKTNLKAPILCFVGPPGVGKTSIGRSIAHSMGRKFHRISLGGVCDQSDIRGHRRTYIGSMPGRIIQGLRVVGVKNPVFLLDEIDKMILDFIPSYVNTPFDLSQVLFIATANSIRSITPALFDRMEVRCHIPLNGLVIWWWKCCDQNTGVQIIHVSGYTHFEKEYIAQNHLIPKMLQAHGLSFDQIRFNSEAVRKIILNYTREAGVRGLERKIGALCRGVAVNIVMRQTQDDPKDAEPLPELPIEVNDELVTKILGPPLFEGEAWVRLTSPGMAFGLAWTAVGGLVQMYEASKMKGKGGLILTGQLGNVLKESARLAHHWIRGNGWRFGLDPDVITGLDIHIHVPQGSVKKEGPSAGITMVTVMMSLLTEQLVRPDLAMTGEITLQGLVLPVGSIKEKIMAAHRFGLKQIILPERNKKNLVDLPECVR